MRESLLSATAVTRISVARSGLKNSFHIAKTQRRHPGDEVYEHQEYAVGLLESIIGLRGSMNNDVRAVCTPGLMNNDARLFFTPGTVDDDI